MLRTLTDKLMEPTCNPCMNYLDASLLLHAFSFAMGEEALKHWRGQSKDCCLCPLSEGEEIPLITSKSARLRGDCRLVCKEWCQVLGGPVLKSVGFPAQDVLRTHATSNRQVCTPPRQFGPCNGSDMFSGLRSVTFAVTLSMLLDPLEGWQEELQALVSRRKGSGAVNVRLQVKKVGRTKREVRAILARASTAAGMEGWSEDWGEHGEEGDEGDEEVGEEEGTGNPPGMPAATPSSLAPLPGNVWPAPAEEEGEVDILEDVPHADTGGTMGGLGGLVFGHGPDNGAEEDALDAITQLRPQILPRPFTLRLLPPPTSGFVLREIDLAGLTTAQEGVEGSSLGVSTPSPPPPPGHHADGGHDRGSQSVPPPHTPPSVPFEEPFNLLDDTVHLLLRHMPGTVERLSLARNPHLHRPLSPLSSHPIAPHLKEIVLDGCWRIDMYHLRAVEAVRGTGLWVDLLHECFGNGRGSSGGSRPCGMKEVVILNGKHRGAWVRCWVIHKAGPSRYHCKVCATVEYDNAVGFSDRAALDISRKHLRHFCGRKVETWAHENSHK